MSIKQTGHACYKAIVALIEAVVEERIGSKRTIDQVEDNFDDPYPIDEQVNEDLLFDIEDDEFDQEPPPAVAAVPAVPAAVAKRPHLPAHPNCVGNYLVPKPCKGGVDSNRLAAADSQGRQLCVTCEKSVHRLQKKKPKN